MEVRCNRCGTEYEFDDVLISERGTTVKCTNCGFQFKVFAAGKGTPERWVVRRASGSEIVFTSLRDLQRGITERRVGPEDMLSRGSEPPRQLGLIAELEPFFAARKPALRAGAAGTLLGMAPPVAPAEESAPATIEDPRSSGTEPVRSATSGTEPVAERRSDTGTMHGIAPPPATMAPPTERDPTPPEESSPAAPEERPEPRREAPQPPPAAPPEPKPPASSELASTLPSTPPGPAPARPAPRAIPSDFDAEAEREGRARSRWIAAVVVGAVVTLVALTVGRRHLRDVLVRTPPEPAVTDDSARVQTLLDEGIRLLESGDLDGAGERLLKASALAERDARVLGALARLETTRADITWLRTRLLDPTDEQAMEVQNRELSRRLSRARSATDAALGASTTEPSAQRAHVDVLRMAGQLDAARDMASKLPQAPLDAHQAYVLAALDLAGEEAPTAQTFERLQLARAGERTPGRAQAALVFALARAGRFDEARTELVRLETASSVAVLAPDLKAYIDRLADPVPTGPTGATTPGDIRPLIELAQRTAAKGDLDGAEALYQKALAQKPGSVEALTGLAEMARQKNDPRRAAEYYERALNYNPNYVPALVGGADQRWQAGQKKIALAYYRKVLRLVGPDTPYGRRAAARVAEAAGSAPSGAATPSTAAPTSTSTPPASGAGTTSGQTE